MYNLAVCGDIMINNNNIYSIKLEYIFSIHIYIFTRDFSCINQIYKYI